MSLAIPAVTVHQWKSTWDKADFSADEHRRRPPEHFYLMSVPAGVLRSLAGIYRRSAAGSKSRSADLGVQRAHDPSRSDEIREYVKHGFPWSGLSASRREDSEFKDLIKPGWLPTAIVVNILLGDDEREGASVDPNDLIQVQTTDEPRAEVVLPCGPDSNWKPTGLPPLEIIDGQHRLWAFDETEDEFELPVVAFNGLDRSWQAYLFYTINIKPKRINTSLAFDLYPLLRTEDWLERFEGHSIYRETRAQELTEALWAHPESPWFERINMLGEPGVRTVTQASWIRSLLATIIKAAEGKRVQIGGLFGAPVGGHDLVLPWNRVQQAAFLIHAWRVLADRVLQTQSEWAQILRDQSNSDSAPFDGQATMLNSDIGVRGFLYVLNDLCFTFADRLQLSSWESVDDAEVTSTDDISAALSHLREQKFAEFLDAMATSLAKYDWRSSKAPGLDEMERQLKSRFRGGSGYRQLREDLLRHLSTASGAVSDAAEEAIQRLGY